MTEEENKLYFGLLDRGRLVRPIRNLREWIFDVMRDTDRAFKGAEKVWLS